MNRRSQQAIEDCEVIIEVMERIKASMPELARRSRHAARDGYPTSSMAGPGQRGAVGRPTESTALSRPMNDPVAMAVRDVLTMVRRLAQDAAVVNGRRIVALDNPLPQYPSCMNCDRAMPIAGENRCDTCYRYLRRNGCDRERPQTA